MDNLDGAGVAATLFSGESLSAFPVLLKALVSKEAPEIAGGAKLKKVLTCKNGEWTKDKIGAFLFPLR